MRERLASRLGFILLSAGCAIGLGNVWRFPYVAGECGGGWFVPIYLFCLAIIGLPVLMMEFAVGRAARRSIARLHGVLTPECRVWRIHGFAGVVGNVLLMMFYTVVTGWMLLYFIKMASGDFVGKTSAEIGAAFGEMLANPAEQTIAMLVVCVGSGLVCSVGLQRGLERITKLMMTFLLVLIVALAVNSLCLKGSRAGLSFYLVPDFARMKSVGVAKVVMEAMNHAFFTLSLGIGAMAIFGSYVDRSHTLLRESLNVAAIDTIVAVVSGLIIIPACFAYGVEPGQGPGLIFVTLPNVFNHMPLGRLWGMLFFVFMSFAALTTVLAVFENIVAILRDWTRWPRLRACVVVACALPVLSLPCILGFNLWRDFAPLGAGTNVLDLEDFVVSYLLLPLGGMAFALYCCHRYGWGWDRFLAEVNTGEGLRLPEGVRIYCAYVLPCLIVGIFVIGMLSKFKVISL